MAHTQTHSSAHSSASSISQNEEEEGKKAGEGWFCGLVFCCGVLGFVGVFFFFFQNCDLKAKALTSAQGQEATNASVKNTKLPF